jgi:hypothetical protein
VLIAPDGIEPAEHRKPAALRYPNAYPQTNSKTGVFGTVPDQLETL